jgi:hypothetical protein
MKFTNPRCLPQRLPRLAVATAATLLLTLNTAALAAPGAHGPNGEHLDGPVKTSGVPSLPRLEARSEAFELVAQLRATELAIVVDRYETNEPVLGAKIEVESGGVKALAVFRPEPGDYTVADAAFVKALAAPGEHGLVFTLVAGSESDLLDGTLVAQAGRAGTAATPDDHGHRHEGDDPGHELERAIWIGSGIAALGLLGGVAWWRQRRSSSGQTLGVL